MYSSTRRLQFAIDVEYDRAPDAVFQSFPDLREQTVSLMQQYDELVAQGYSTDRDCYCKAREQLRDWEAKEMDKLNTLYNTNIQEIKITA